MRSLLVINPNTSESVTTLLRTHVQMAVGPHIEVQAVTARMGAPYISDEASYAIAAHAGLDVWAHALATGARPDAVLLGCFGDPGLHALRESSPVPVSGLAEAAFAQAAAYGRFAVVTGGERWRAMLLRLAQALGHGDALALVHTVAPTGAELAADPVAAQDLLAHACAHAARASGAKAVILGGAGLAGMAAQIAPKLEVPVIDSVVSGGLWARVATGSPGGGLRARAGFNMPLAGVSPELMALGPKPS